MEKLLKAAKDKERAEKYKDKDKERGVEASKAKEEGTMGTGSRGLASAGRAGGSSSKVPGRSLTAAV